MALNSPFEKRPLPKSGPSAGEPRLNERIRVPEVRLIDEQGNQVGVVRTDEALRMARERNLDLMEVAPNSRPPVCKILDYGKFKYEKKKKETASRKKQVVIKVKEIQIRPNTDTHDRDFKFKNARSFLEDGDKVKVSMFFRGREIVNVDKGRDLLDEMAKLLSDVGTIESSPKLEGKRMIMMLAPSGVKKRPDGT